MFKVGELSVDLVRRIVKVVTTEVKLSPREYEILRTLVQHAGKVLTHQALCERSGAACRCPVPAGPRRQLRQKIEPDPEQPRYILTETGGGGWGVWSAILETLRSMGLWDLPKKEAPDG